MQPKKIKLADGVNLKILWTDGIEESISLKDLRKNCPCATCAAERDKQGKKYIPLFTESQVSVRSINQVGNYAIQIKWQDGHDTGIYEYKFLRNYNPAGK
ncbi:MAG: DUF971 domain-containing protein [Ignavibacteriaceae bacterium]|jgi:DUF971 family protein|nr:DUF971 domain-containing protein [Ignavibacteriaceae bacterium]